MLYFPFSSTSLIFYFLVLSNPVGQVAISWFLGEDYTFWGAYNSAFGMSPAVKEADNQLIGTEKSVDRNQCEGTCLPILLSITMSLWRQKPWSWSFQCGTHLSLWHFHLRLLQMWPSWLTFPVCLLGIQNPDIPVYGFPHVPSSIDKLRWCLAILTQLIKNRCFDLKAECSLPHIFW